jgi:hypothetical protein
LVRDVKKVYCIEGLGGAARWKIILIQNVSGYTASVKMGGIIYTLFTFIFEIISFPMIFGVMTQKN